MRIDQRMRVAERMEVSGLYVASLLSVCSLHVIEDVAEGEINFKRVLLLLENLPNILHQSVQGDGIEQRDVYNFLQSAHVSPIPRDRMLVPNKCLENNGVID